MKSLLITGLLFLVGCVPAASYHHFSNPTINNDGYDLICVGGEMERKKMRSSLRGCKNLWDDQPYFLGEVVYRPQG
jgi:hypothetical protein